MNNPQEDLIEEMKLCRKFCSMIHKARNQIGLQSVKYPLTDVKISHYFVPELRDLISEECNIVGYMDIPPVEYDHNPILNEHYVTVTEGEDWVSVSTTRSDWQQEIADKREINRQEALQRKELDK
jgi:hypothetical protein